MKPVLDLVSGPSRPSLAACEVLPGEAGAAPVILASPHSGSYYPDHFVAALQVPLIDLRRTEDAFVDELFNPGEAGQVTRVMANYARSFVDLNRDARELDPNMFEDGVPRTSGLPSARVKAGLGCLPRIAASGRQIHAGPLSQAEGAWRLDHVYDGYHERLGAQLSDLLSQWSDVVLIDCHSMPSVQPGRGALADIVLGDRFGSSCNGRLTRLVERAFRRHGLSVARNAPYAGGFTTRKYGRPRRGVHVLQIEVNRGLYMDELAVEKSAGFEKLQAILAAVIADICAYALRENQ
ncbi:MAG: N-formylglutamate amidohydrolase [Alphaproteobacteria bacterium]|nr:N-formylglutamate amidohydrolase [Alphaproteobacteria bacterium]